jgi:hypothetical protein
MIELEKIAIDQSSYYTLTPNRHRPPGHQLP